MAFGWLWVFVEFFLCSGDSGSDHGYFDVVPVPASGCVLCVCVRPCEPLVPMFERFLYRFDVGYFLKGLI